MYIFYKKKKQKYVLEKFKAYTSYICESTLEKYENSCMKNVNF